MHKYIEIKAFKLFGCVCVGGGGGGERGESGIDF